MQFGYTEKQAAIALIKTDNDFNLALDVSLNISLISYISLNAYANRDKF